MNICANPVTPVVLALTAAFLFALGIQFTRKGLRHTDPRSGTLISIGTATLAAFVGAGGLGEPIITGLTLNDNRLILEGAIPAALLAIAVELLFEALERTTVPAHLRV